MADDICEPDRHSGSPLLKKSFLKEPAAAPKAAHP
jgi:hypothetical protein